MEDASPSKHTGEHRESDQGLEACIRHLEQQVAEKESLAADATQKLERIEKLLAKMGVTVEDLEKGFIEVKLMGDRIVSDVAMRYPKEQRRIIAALQGKQGGEIEEIAKRFNMPLSEIEALYADFVGALGAEFKDRARRGITSEQLVIQGYLPLEP